MKWQCGGGGGAAGGWVHPGCSAVPVVGRGSRKSSLAFAAFLLSLLLGVGDGRLLSIGLGLFRRLDALPPQQELLLPEVFQIGRRHVALEWLPAGEGQDEPILGVEGDFGPGHQLHRVASRQEVIARIADAGHGGLGSGVGEDQGLGPAVWA